ncbi:uL14 family ribosomal protein, partial [Bacillus sp. WP8]|uniref:uL14 family ribosomal protein n=1 Tax=Bacillus sp. WP8 TaxID=756828 RepID=UPI0011A57854
VKKKTRRTIHKKPQLLKPLILPTNTPPRKNHASYITFHQNPSLIIPHHNTPPPTPIFPPLPPQLPQNNYIKILSLPPQLL